VSAPQPDERDVDHGEVSRRDSQDQTEVGPEGKSLVTPMNLMMGAVILFAAIWFFATQLTG
jgi:hypothetical protein